MEEKEINPTESLAIIEEMLLKTKRHFSNDSFYFILWGWLTLIASVSQFILLPMFGEKSALVWFIMPIGGVISMIYSFKKNKQVKVKTYIDLHIAYIWAGVALGITVLVIAMIAFHSTVIMPLFILLYAIGTYTSGGVLQFKPLLIGGLCCFAISLLAFFVDGRYQLLLIAVAILVSYLIPGYLMKAKFKSYGTERS